MVASRGREAPERARGGNRAVSEYVLLACSALVSIAVNAAGRLRGRRGPLRILIVKLDHLGDVVLATPAIRALREAHPGAEIDALVSLAGEPALQGNPHLTSILRYDSRRYRRPHERGARSPGDAGSARVAFVSLRDVARRRYTAIVELRGDWSTLLLPFLAGATRRADRGTVRLHDWLARHGLGQPGVRPLLHEVETNLAVVRALAPGNRGAQPPADARVELVPSAAASESMRGKLKGLGVDFEAPIVCVHPGAAWRPRAWRPERFAAVADWIQAHYHAQVAFLGSAEERDIEAALRAACRGPRTFWLFGMLSIPEVAALFGSARLLIGNDGGLAHVAAARGLPSIVLFGPQEPARFRPWSERSVVLHHRVHCCPCRQTVCIHPENPCVNLIEIEEVEAKVRELLGPPGPR